MKLDPTLSRKDRIGIGLFGVALLAVAIFVDFEKPWTRLVPAACGVFFVIRGACGT